MRKGLKLGVVALLLLAGLSAGAITAHALYAQEVNQLTTRATPSSSSEGLALTRSPNYGSPSPVTVSAVQVSLQTAVTGSLPDAGPPLLPDAGPDYLTGGIIQMWRYNPIGGWTHVESMDCPLGMYTGPDAGIMFSDGGANSNVRLVSWTCPEQVLNVVGPGDRFVAQGVGITTAMGSPVDTVTIEGVTTDPSVVQ